MDDARARHRLTGTVGMRERNGMDLIACRSCGRAEVDVIVVARDAEAAVAGDPANPGGDHG